ncbi:ead/Ea22-like family protein [Candidatus Erwinia dacicola]|uniref:Ead/Ea22-like family protein n=1 Tax=Candidatus Erwinia dacicola TaxID=252393 RepID=A0A1E7Z333_9GAMM|nr:ead/Ea22-like family protein [Candidatus Erwinia dacicola]OFC63055.1 hypothetical protein BBW68_07200 [Candidatus Erwinia dacicola]RAP71548.1 ead/Ea22-like family protein [Candidatus Erwinia dacicola]
MSNIDKRALREAAEKATPGPWYVHDKPCEDGNYGIDTSDKEFLAEAVVWWGFSRQSIWREEDAKHIAAANPAAVLALLDELEAAEKRIAELEATSFSKAAIDVLAERQRQQSAEGWTTEHDDDHSCGEMALAASSYAQYAHRKPIAPAIPFNWPWEPEWFKQQGPRRDLVKAGALILAEIERIDRAATGKVAK